MNMCDPDEVADRRTLDMPLWRFARDVWDFQTKRGALAMTENPFGSVGLKLSFMEKRPKLNRAKVAQCRFGLKDSPIVNSLPWMRMILTLPDFWKKEDNAFIILKNIRFWKAKFRWMGDG